MHCTLSDMSEAGVAEDDKDTCYKAEVYRAVASGLRNYAGAVHRNTGAHILCAQQAIDDQSQRESCSLLADFTNPQFITPLMFDDFEAKVAAYESACHLVLQLAQTDCDIVNGAQLASGGSLL